MSFQMIQERFLIQRTNMSNQNETVYLWWVPLTYTSDFKTVATTWMANNQSSKTITLDFNITDDQWIIFNINQTGNTLIIHSYKLFSFYTLSALGFFRVNYDLLNWFVPYTLKAS